MWFANNLPQFALSLIYLTYSLWRTKPFIIKQVSLYILKFLLVMLLGSWVRGALCLFFNFTLGTNVFFSYTSNFLFCFTFKSTMHLVKFFFFFFSLLLTYFLLDFLFCMGFPGDSVVKNHLPMQKTWAWSWFRKIP